MISDQCREDGLMFILEIPDTYGVCHHWVRRLRGTEAAYWYQIFATSDWPLLRGHVVKFLGHPASPQVAAAIKKSEHCVVLQPSGMRLEELEIDGTGSIRSLRVCLN